MIHAASLARQLRGREQPDSEHLAASPRTSEGGNGSNYIETIPKRGYRFIANVKEVDEAANGNSNIAVSSNQEAFGINGNGTGTTRSPALTLPVPQTLNVTNRKRLLSIVGGCIALGLAITLIYWLRHRSTNDGFTPKSIAVLPFKTIGTDGESDLLGLGMADALIIKLSRLEQLTVLPTSSVFPFTHREKDAVQIGRDLGVEGVLDGTSRDGDRVGKARVDQLKDGRLFGRDSSPNVITASLPYRGSQNNGESLRPQVSNTDKKPLTTYSTDNFKAYQGVLLDSTRNRRRENLPKAINYLEQAVQRIRCAGSRHPGGALLPRR